MIIEGIAIVLVGLLNLFLGLLVLLRNPKNLVHIIFSSLEFFFACWAFSLFFYTFPFIGSSFFWIKITYVVVTLYSSFILLFSFVFPRRIFPRAFKAGIVVNTLYLLLSFWLLFFTNLWVVKVVFYPTMGLQTVLGPAYVWWSLATWVPFLWASINFIYKSKNTKNALEKVQMQYFWISFILFATFVCIPDVIIPLIWHNTRYFSVGVLSNLFFSGIVAYLILRHRFLDIRRIIVQTMARGAILVGSGIIYFVIVYLIGRFIFNPHVNVWYIATGVIFAILINQLIAPAQKKLEKMLRNAISKDVYERDEVLDSVSRIISTTTDFKELTKKITREISEIIGFSQAAILRTFPKEKKLHFYFPTEEMTIEAPNEYYEIENATKDGVIITDELSEGAVKRYLEKRKVGLIGPLKVRGDVFGYLVLYRKTSGNVYTTFDVKTIEMILSQVSIALQNALHIEKIEHFNKLLRQEIKKATEELRLANKKLIEIDRQKDDFIGMASHELRTPTTVIKTFLWILFKKEKSLTSEVREKVEHLYHLSHHLGEMIKEMLDVSLIESGKMQFNPESFDIVDLTEKILVGLKVTLPNGKQVTYQKDGKFIVYADRAKIHQVINNLVTNAVKYTPEKGRIMISFSQKNNIVTTQVADNGEGVDKKHVNILFTKFGKVPKKDASDREIPGSGLGLYISKEIVERSKGNMWVESEVGKGSRFYFTLPAKKSM